MLYIWIDVRELGPRYRAWALEPVFLGPKLHSTSYNRPCTWTLSLGPDSSEHNLGPGTRNNTTVNTLSKPPPPPQSFEAHRTQLPGHAFNNVTTEQTSEVGMSSNAIPTFPTKRPLWDNGIGPPFALRMRSNHNSPTHPRL